MTNREAIGRLRGMIKETTGDTHLSNRLLYSFLSTNRNLLLERNKERIYKTNELPVHRLDTERVNLSEVSCVPIDCTVCRVKIGNVAATKDGPVISGIGSEDLSVMFSLVAPSQYARKVRLDPKGKYAFIEGEYLYLSECMPCVRASFVKEQSESGCSKLDNIFFIPAYLEEPVFQMSVQGLSLYMQKPLDVNQNANPNG